MNNPPNPIYNPHMMTNSEYQKIYLDLEAGMSPAEVKTQNNMSPEQWETAASLVFDEHMKRQKQMLSEDFPGQDASGDLASVNTDLAAYSLAFPRYGTHMELGTIVELLTQNPRDIDVIAGNIFRIVMNPTMRAVATEAYFNEPKIDEIDNIFYEFAYIIDSSLMAFYRGNVVASLITIIPVIEGVLLRWQGFPRSLAKKPSFPDTIKFLKDSKFRQPRPKSIHLFEPWMTAAVNIVENHLFKNTSHPDGSLSYDNFNRHIALHLLNDAPFCTPMNIMRSYLLLDILFELFLCEHRIAGFQLNAKYGATNIAEAVSYKAYSQTYNSYISDHSPEDSLGRYKQIEKLPKNSPLGLS